MDGVLVHDIYGSVLWMDGNTMCWAHGSCVSVVSL